MVGASGAVAMTSTITATCAAPRPVTNHICTCKPAALPRRSCVTMRRSHSVAAVRKRPGSSITDHDSGDATGASHAGATIHRKNQPNNSARNRAASASSATPMPHRPGPSKVWLCSGGSPACMRTSTSASGCTPFTQDQRNTTARLATVATAAIV
ncbi:hypothetical protein D3C78_1411360 [compost metagenome]